MTFPNDAARFDGTVIDVANLLTARPVNTLVTFDGSLYRSTDAVSAAYSPVGADGGSPIFASGSFTCTTQSTNVTIPDIRTSDMLIAVVDIEDTGASLDGIAVSRAAGSNTGVVITNTAPTTNDGVIKWVVLRFIA